MTKLTTESLDKLQDNLLQFQDHYSDPADKENCDIFVDALHMLDEFKAAKEKILAYEQAAKNPIAFTEACEISNMNATGLYMRGFPDSKQGRNIPIYAAPVLPKQPELVEKLKKVMNSWLAMEPKLAFQPEFTDVMMLLDAEAAPAQPVSEPYKLPDNLDFDCEFENGDYDIDEEPWLRGRVDGFNEALQVIKRSLNTKQKPTAQESE